MDKLDIPTDQINQQIIGITCSAAVVNSLQALIGSIPEETDASFLIFQNLSQPQQENLAALLQKTTRIAVEEIVNSVDLKPNHIYVIPENNILVMDHAVLKIKRQTREEKVSECLDHFYGLLAEKFAKNAIGISLEWSPLDGGFGLKKIREKGGFAIAAIDQIGFSLNEIVSGYFDYYSKPSDVSEQLSQLKTAFQIPTKRTAEEQQAFDTIVELVPLKSGVPLQKYNPMLLQQKIVKRMVMTKQASVQKYLNTLQDNTAEQDQLFYEIHSTTAFFQNSTADFDVLTETALPAIIEKKTGTDLRIWSAGCATGEEVYLLAIIHYGTEQPWKRLYFYNKTANGIITLQFYIMQNILLIDDDNDDRSFFIDAAHALAESIEVTALENCFTLIKDLENNLIEQPDLIVMDINMPEKDGWTCLKELKSHLIYRDIPVIMYSTTNPEQGAEQAKKSGALSFFTKPYNFKELKEAVKEIAFHLERGTLNKLPEVSKRFF